jgi:exodeoxyribonuclease VII small subunit
VSKSPKPARFEEMLTRLEGLVRALESEDLPLEEAIAAFEEGVVLARECQSRLDSAERRIEILQRQPDGTLASEPLPDLNSPPEVE